MDENKKKKIDRDSEKILVTQLQDRYGYPKLVTLLVPNPNFAGRKNKHRRNPLEGD